MSIGEPEGQRALGFKELRVGRLHMVGGIITAAVRLARKVYQSAVSSRVLLNKAPPNSEAYSHYHFLLALTSSAWLAFIWTWPPGLGWFRWSHAPLPPGLSGHVLLMQRQKC